jgi:hypothetical protein
MLKDADKHLSADHRRRVWSFTIALFLLCVSLGSCKGKEDCGVHGVLLDDVDGGEPYCLAGTEVENPHFEMPDLAPSKRYWIAAGDKLAPAFDRFELHFQRQGKMCDFLDNTPASNGDDCLVCNLCGDLHSRGCKTTDLNQPKSEITEGTFKVVVDVGFMPSATMRDVFDFAERGGITRLRSACPNQTRMPFATDFSGLYRFTGTNEAALRGTDGTAKVEIVNDANPHPTVSYQLTSHCEDVQGPTSCAAPSPTPNAQCPACVWFKVPAPDTSAGLREESFSPNLRVTKVRVLKGTPSVDPNTGRFKLDEMSTTIAHPSRVVLFPAASDGFSVLGPDDVRCYANPSVEDGDLNLTTCRDNYQVDCTSPNCALRATPHYTDGNPADSIIWFVEFNPAEGGVIPSFSFGEVLAIEFTLERV